MNDKNRIVDEIQSKIYTIRGLKVILDSDLAKFYEIETKQLNKSVKRNIERFPSYYMFQLTDEEYNSLRFQFGTLEHGKGKHRKYLPYAFTEQGVAMLSGILRNLKAINISIQIIDAFVFMRQFILNNVELFSRLDNIEKKQIQYEMKTDKQLETIFNALDNSNFKQGIFYDGQVFDSYSFVSNIIRMAKKLIILIDNYVDYSVLTLFSKRNIDVDVIIYTKISKQLKLDLKKFNSQYKSIQIRAFDRSHDRFLILDDKDIFHIGASLKDLGKKWFAFSKLNINPKFILSKLK
jgi:phage regulator Rha-like protein